MATPRLRGVMSLNLVVSLAGAMVVVNTVVLVLLGLALGVLILALKLWPSVDSSECWHNHNDLPGDHPHVANASSSGAHRHNYVIDSLHPKWPD